MKNVPQTPTVRSRQIAISTYQKLSFELCFQPERAARTKHAWIHSRCNINLMKHVIFEHVHLDVCKNILSRYTCIDILLTRHFYTSPGRVLEMPCLLSLVSKLYIRTTRQVEMLTDLGPLPIEVMGRNSYLGSVSSPARKMVYFGGL